MEEYQIGKDITSLQLVVSRQTQDIKTLAELLQEAQNAIETLGKAHGMDYDVKKKAWTKEKVE